MAAVHPLADMATLSATLFARGARGPCPLLEALTCLSQPNSIFPTFCLQAAAAASLLGTGSVPAQCARGLLHDDKLWRLVLPYEDSRYFVLFNGKSIFSLKQKAVGSQFILRASTRPSRSPYCSGATPRVRPAMRVQRP
jgi:hypothetical protein